MPKWLVLLLSFIGVFSFVWTAGRAASEHSVRGIVGMIFSLVGATFLAFVFAICLFAK